MNSAQVPRPPSLYRNSNFLVGPQPQGWHVDPRAHFLSLRLSFCKAKVTTALPTSPTTCRPSRVVQTTQEDRQKGTLRSSKSDTCQKVL